MSIKDRMARLIYKTAMGDRYLTNARRDSPILALTFDDGPHPTYTPAILDLLARHRARATFFLTGVQAEQFPEIVARTLAEGHEIANHSYRHTCFASLPVKAQLEEIEKTDAILSAHDQREWHWFRPPQGKLPISLFLKLWSRRHPVAMWSHDSYDYRNAGAAAIVERYQATPARGGEVILFHDDNADTVDALQRMLLLWIQQGYAFDTLSAMHEPDVRVQ